MDFDRDRFVALIRTAVEPQRSIERKGPGGRQESVDFTDGPATLFQPEAAMEGLVEQGEAVGVKSNPTWTRISILSS